MPRSTTIALLALALTIHGFSQTTQAPQFTISTVAGNGTPGFSGDGGPATSAALNGPYGLCTDTAGNLYIADFSNARIRKVSLSGTITTVAGMGLPGFGGDGGPATAARLNGPIRVRVDAGNLYIADYNNHRVRKVTPDGIISTVAGNGNAAYSGDGGPATAASLNNPDDMVVDAAGNLFVADERNNVVRKVDTNGIITTVAGHGIIGYSGDNGPAPAASLSGPASLAMNGDDLFVSDQGNRRIRKISKGIITTVAGTGGGGYSGDGGPATSAQLNNPAGISIDGGILYIAETINHTVRAVVGGTITTVAGNGSLGFSGDGGPATSATLNNPRSVAAFAGRVYVADTDNRRIRLLTPVAQAPAVSGVVSASAFGGFTSISPGSWIEIYGSNLSSTTRGWAGSDFTGVNAPTSLDGTTVSIGGKPAFIDYISPTQVNALVSSDTPLGTQQLVVRSAAGTSAAYGIAVNSVQPGFLSPSSFLIGGKQYAVALFTDGTYVLPVGAISGVTSRPAKAGDVIVLYGVGFGPVIPDIPAGQIVQQSNGLASSLQISAGGAPATLSYSGLAGSFTGLYQFNVTVPPVTGNVPLTFTLGTAAGTQTLYLAVQN